MSIATISSFFRLSCFDLFDEHDQSEALEYPLVRLREAASSLVNKFIKKLAPVSGVSIPVLGMRLKQEKSVMLLLKTPQLVTVNFDTS